VNLGGKGLEKEQKEILVQGLVEYEVENTIESFALLKRAQKNLNTV